MQFIFVAFTIGNFIEQLLPLFSKHRKFNPVKMALAMNSFYGSTLNETEEYFCVVIVLLLLRTILLNENLAQFLIAPLSSSFDN